MISIVKDQDLAKEFQNLKGMSFVVLATGSESKTGSQDPEALRFLDVVLLDANQLKSLKILMQRASNSEPIFQRRSVMSKQLVALNMSDHSFKGGCENILSELIRNSMIPETVLPMLLKHKQNIEAIASTTAGYLSKTARVNILQAKQIFRAGVVKKASLGERRGVVHKAPVFENKQGATHRHTTTHRPHTEHVYVHASCFAKV